MKRIIILIVLVSFVAGAYFLSRENRHMSETVIKLSDESPCFSESGLDRKSLSEQIALMKSKEAVGNGLKLCQLEAKTEYSREECIDLLNSYLEIDIDEETDLITIRTYAGSERQAQMLNYAVVKGYEKILNEWYRNSSRRNRISEIYKLEQMKSLQEKAVSEWKTRLDECIKVSAGSSVISYTQSRYDIEKSKLRSIMVPWFTEENLEYDPTPIIYHQYGWNSTTFEKDPK